MIFDSLTELFDSRALTAGATVSDVIDCGVSRAIGPGALLHIAVVVEVAPVATGTYTLELQTADDGGFATATTLETVVIPATTPQGRIMAFGIGHNVRRYMRLVATLGGASPAVTISAFVSDQAPTSIRSFPDGSQP